MCIHIDNENTRRSICPAIIMVDASKSFELYKDSLQEGLQYLVGGLRRSAELRCNHLTYLTIILFNTETRLLENNNVKVCGYNTDSKELDFIDEGKFELHCYGKTDITNVLKYGKELGEKQYAYLRDKKLARLRPMYFLFSDMINNVD